MAEPKAKSKKMGPTDPMKEEEQAKAQVEADPRPKKEEENLGKASPMDINDTPATVPPSSKEACGR
jgi:hypothetical protein